MADMREVEKSEISHTNAIMKYNPTKKIFTAAKNETGVWSHTLAELASRNWSLYPVHSYRATLMAWWEGWKTGIGALEDVGNIAWHRCNDGRKSGERNLFDERHCLGVSQTTQDFHQPALQHSYYGLFKLYGSQPVSV